VNSGYSFFKSNLVNLIRMNGDSHCTIIMSVQILTTSLFHMKISTVSLLLKQNAVIMNVTSLQSHPLLPSK